MGPNPTPSEVEEGYSVQGGGEERQEEGLGCRDGTVTLPAWETSSEVTAGKAASGKCLLHCVDAPLFSFMFS